MAKHLEREVNVLKKKLLALSAVVEESLRRAIRAVVERDANLARGVIATDAEIDQTEVDVEEECLKILALHQPVAIDLRFIVAVLKIDNDLERIGDLAVNIAERAVYLSEQPGARAPFDVNLMAEKAQWMLSKSLDALVNLDTWLAREICAKDDEVDSMNRQAYELVKDRLHENPRELEILIQYLSISRYLERVADHATNIAEDVMYMTEGTIVRHRAESFGAHAGEQGANND